MPSEDILSTQDEKARLRPSFRPRRAHDCNATIDQFGAYLANAFSCEDDRQSFIREIRRCPICHDKLLALELVIFLEAETLRNVEEPLPVEESDGIEACYERRAGQ